MGKYTVATLITPINEAFGQCLWTELHQAAAKEDVASVRALVRAGHDVNAVCNRKTPLDIAKNHAENYPQSEACKKILKIMTSVG